MIAAVTRPGAFFEIPSWTWHCHKSTWSNDAILFAMSDRPLLNPFGYHREEGQGQTAARERAELFACRF